jgi:tetratricopeptide (TPR) repeat protein
MQHNPFYQGKEDMQQLLLDYKNLKAGKKHGFISEESFEIIIDYFDDNENINEAIVAASIGIEQYPYNAELMFKKADLLIATRKYNEALFLLEKADIYDAKSINYYILMTDALLALDKQDEAVEILVKGLKKFEGEEKVELLFELADVYDDYEQFDKIFECLLIILEEEPTNEEALYKICFWTDFTGRFEESIKVHEKIIDNYPYNEIAWFNLGTAFQGLKLYEKAIDAYQYAVVIDEKFDYAYRNMGDAFLRLKKYKEAIECLEKVLEISKPEEVIYEAIAHCYHRMGNIAQARFNYKKAVHLSQNDAKLIYKLATTYMQEGLWDLAIKHLETALSIARNHKEFNLAMGECKMHQKKYNEAATYISRVIAQKNTSIKAWELMIRCTIAAQDLNAAIQFCHFAMENTHKKPIFFYYKTAVLFLQKKSKEAFNHLEIALTTAPKLVYKFLDIMPDILQNQKVVEMISRYKKIKKKGK